MLFCCVVVVTNLNFIFKDNCHINNFYQKIYPYFIALLFYLTLKNENDSFNQPIIKNSPPKGVINQILFGLTPSAVIA